MTVRTALKNVYRRKRGSPFHPGYSRWRFVWDGRLRSQTIGDYIREVKKDRVYRIAINIARLRLRCSDYPKGHA